MLLNRSVNFLLPDVPLRDSPPLKSSRWEDQLVYLWGVTDLKLGLKYWKGVFEHNDYRVLTGIPCTWMMIRRQLTRVQFSLFTVWSQELNSVTWLNNQCPHMLVSPNPLGIFKVCPSTEETLMKVRIAYMLLSLIKMPVTWLKGLAPEYCQIEYCQIEGPKHCDQSWREKLFSVLMRWSKLPNVYKLAIGVWNFIII